MSPMSTSAATISTTVNEPPSRRGSCVVWRSSALRSPSSRSSLRWAPPDGGYFQSRPWAKQGCGGAAPETILSLPLRCDAPAALGRQCYTLVVKGHGRCCASEGTGMDRDASAQGTNASQTEDAAALRELAVRLLRARFPGDPEAAGEMQLLVGEVPGGLPVELPLPPGSRVVGSFV